MSDTETAPERPPREQEGRSPAFAEGDDPLAPSVVAAGTLVGRYHIKGLLGSGGMGQVYTALDPELGRTVALKLVRPDGAEASGRGRTRLLREAQALAKLQHRNVVAVHDVGTAGSQVFIAMELVAGPTLGAWLAARPRTWPEIRDVFVAAGHGLVAAHAAGIVHRDFKPSNVIVGADRVVVVDFGLAARDDDESGEAEVQERPSGSVLDVNLTLTGERVGTPRYMAPEQHASQPVTPLADQFSFACALWGAVFGVTPFPGRTSAEVVQSMQMGPPPLPLQRNVPERARKALLRALALRPEERWPTLADLLDELTFDPAARRRRILAGVAVAFTIVATPLAFIAGRQPVKPDCTAPGPTTWNEDARTAVRAAFIATGKPFAGDSFDRVDAALKSRLEEWAVAREDACAATEIRHEQSTVFMDARMQCLAQAHTEIAAFVNVLRTADGRTVERATSGAARAGDLAACKNPAALTAVMQLPAGPELRARAADLERGLAQVDALVLVGKMKDAFAAAPALVESARLLDHPPLLARALRALGETGCEAGNPKDAAQALYEAARAAAAGHDDRQAAHIGRSLVFCVGMKDKNYAAAQALVETAEASLLRIGAPLDLRALLYGEESRLRLRTGDLINAFGLGELALMTQLRLYGDAHSEVGRGYGEIGDILFIAGAYRGALDLYAKALPILERTRGPSHPVVTGFLNNMAGAAAASGDLALAARSLERALAMEATNYGPDGGATPAILRNLANVRELAGQLDEAQKLVERAAALDGKALRPDHPDIAFDEYLFCQLAIDRHDLAAASEHCDRSLAIRVAALGPDGPDVADTQLLVARIAADRNDLATARRLVETAMAVHRKAIGAHHPSVASDETALAGLLLQGGDARGALPLLEHALVVQEGARSGDAAEVVAVRALLADALRQTGDVVRARVLADKAASVTDVRADLAGQARFALARTLEVSDPPRAVDLARQARALLASSPAPANAIAGVDRWLAVHAK